MQRSSPLRRKTPIRRRNPKRLHRLRAGQFGPQAALCRRLPCCACGGRPSDPHHLHSRGAGGLDDSCVPLCRECHGRAHSLGSLFWTRVRVDPQAVLALMRMRVIDENISELPVSPLLLWLDG